MGVDSVGSKPVVLPKPVTEAKPVAATVEAKPAAPVVASKPAAPADTFQSTSGVKATKGDPVAPPADQLDDVRSGKVVLANGAKGEGVRRAQELLMTAGYKLPKYGADADFGGETQTALKKFQKDQGMDPPSGKLDAETVKKLDTAAAKNAKFPEYDKMFADGVLNTTIAVGYDEKKNHVPEIKKIVEGLGKQGYKPVDMKSASDADIKKMGLDPAKVDRDATYFVKKFEYKGKEVVAATKLITPDTPNAKEKFAKAMNEDEVVMYTGHGRVGSGPDFDDKHDAKGNYVIGKPTEQNYVTLGDNDLKKAKMTNEYQLLFFDGCNTKHYLDDLRSIPKNKDSKNMDIVGANTTLDWDTSSTDVLAMNEGLTSGRSINDIQSNLEAANRKGPKDKTKRFLADGFSDNTPVD